MPKEMPKPVCQSCGNESFITTTKGALCSVCKEPYTGPK